MSQSRKDRDLQDEVPGQPESTPEEDNDQRSGRVGYDERGNPIWEWKLETGVYSRDVTTSKLKKLELDDLSIADTAPYKRPPGLDSGSSTPKEPRRMPGGGFNPYNNSPPANAGSNPYDSARALGEQLDPKQSDSPGPRKQMDLKKLEEWIEIRKRVQEQKERGDDDDDDDDDE
jgi:hypothetical protein